MLYLVLWPALMGGSAALIGAGLQNGRTDTRTDLVALPGAATAVLLVILMFPTSPMSDGLISAGLHAGVWALVVAVCLPGIDGLLVASRSGNLDRGGAP